ncbi:MAG: glycosyltransferase [Akkermansiaceae bacterium]|nr:glycosyltransferase [Verrucomicrobiales bacterium]
MPPRLLYFSPYSSGGLADYAHEQANALSGLGIQVTFLTTPNAARAKPVRSYDCWPLLKNEPTRTTRPSRLARRLQTARSILGNARTLEKCIRREGIGSILFGAYFEYLAPLWASRLGRLARSGAVFGSVVHDPLRNFIVGPLWWHRWSTACGYSFMREAFIHEPMHLPTVKPMPQLRTTVIPHGPYRFPAATETRAAVRQRLKIPAATELLLAFGHVRDAKNLDLVLQAMVQRPEFHLLVAGLELGAGQRPVSYYQQRAADLKVADRCRWDARHVPEDEIGNYFEAADLVLLTYNAAFRSASGVLNTAIQFRKPCLASSGPSNLRTAVETFDLGIWVEPDSSAAIAAGLDQWLRRKPAPNWTGYREENSWEKNAALVVERMLGQRTNPHSAALT